MQSVITDINSILVINRYRWCAEMPAKTSYARWGLLVGTRGIASDIAAIDELRVGAKVNCKINLSGEFVDSAGERADWLFGTFRLFRRFILRFLFTHT